MGLSSRYLIGIDLGTTNSAVAYIDTQEPAARPTAIRIFQIPQLVAPAEIQSVPVLPSFLYFATAQDFAPESLRLPWKQSEQPGSIVGVLAREQGALVAGRQVASAKSWLCHPAVDRTAKILPWGSEQPEFLCSPVEASAAYLAHMRDAWNHQMAQGNEEWFFENQTIVLTVPASFDEEARELTILAAGQAGLKHLTLLEEPLAAFYAWIATHRQSLKRELKDGFLVLICDVGGGTTDFSLIRVRIVNGEVAFERTAIGEHLLLGGDNVDLALARALEEKIGRQTLSLRQRNALRRLASSAKERLLSDNLAERPEKVPITIAGSGRSVVGASITTELTREEVMAATIDGFLPMVAADDLPVKEKRSGLRELGLPYASEPAITRHLAAFLTASHAAEEPATAGPKMIRPDAILFNGGFFTPEITRQRVVEVVAHWFHQKGKRWRPKVLSNSSPDNAVAIGAAYYGQVRLGGGLRISAGSGRAYYIGLESTGINRETEAHAVCVMPRGTEEGTTLELNQRQFTLLANRPVSFTLFSSTTRNDAHGDVVTLDLDEVHRHAPLITVMRYGKRSQQAELAVELTATFTEVGTLEIWCVSQKTDHRWRLQFQLRGALAEPELDEPSTEETETIISDDAVGAAERLIDAVFATKPDPAADQVAPESLTARLEAILGYGKDAWPMATIRRLCDALMTSAEGRKKSPKYEARWLNLYGFCLRPGFGAVLDDWRINQSRRIYLAGLTSAKDLQCQVEWLVLWRRVAGGLNPGQQRELYQRQMAPLGIGKKRTGKINTQVDREGWRLLASLEHLSAPVRQGLGKELLSKIKDEPTNKSYLWSLGRLGARLPLYGPINCVVPAETAAEWIKSLLKLPVITIDTASAIVQLGAVTGDPLRDIDNNLRQQVIRKLEEAGIDAALLASLREYIPPTRNDAMRIFGESLPEGLRLVS